jgi:16S rRNA (uracil1498-N3)-methyltransferase
LAHWQGVAVAAAEQCGRNRVPTVHPAVTLIEWLKKASPGERWVLSLSEGTLPLKQMTGNAPVTVLSGPEGGLSPAEDTAALAAGFVPVTLGSRVLRAETAPLAVLAVCSA